MLSDAVPLENLSMPSTDASAGAPLSFYDSLVRSFEYDNLVESQFGAAQGFIDREQENFQRIREAGGEPPKSALVNIDGYDVFGLSNLNRAERAVRAIRDDDRRTYDDMFKAYDEDLRVLQQRFPQANIKTYGEMYRGMLDEMAALQLRNLRTQNTIGGFIGSAFAGINPGTNPLNALTIPVGGFGKNFLTRILTEGGAQGAVQALDEFTGTRENRRLLGIEPTTEGTLANIGNAALFGAAFQGAGELVSFGARKAVGHWFRKLPNDIPPEPPVLEPTPAAPPETIRTQREIPADTEARILQAVRESVGVDSKNFRRATVADYNHTVIHMDRIDGPNAWEIPPPMHTRPIDVKQLEVPEITPATKGATVDEIARQVDPETFKQWDELQAQVVQNRQFVKQAIGDRNVDAHAELQQFDDEIAAKTNALAGATKKQRAKLEADIADLKDAKNARVAGLFNMSPNTSADYRRQLMAADEKLRDLAPAVSRAYARAKGKWSDDEALRGDIQRMINGEKVTPDEAYGPPAPTVLDKVEMQLQSRAMVDTVPELAQSPAKVGEAAVDALKRYYEGVDKSAERALDEFRAAIPRLLKAEGADAVLDIDGVGKLDLSTEMVVDVDGDGRNIRKMTAKEYLQTLLEDEEALQAVMTCTVGSASKTV